MTFTVQNGFFSYERSRATLQNIGFSVSSGQILSILGPNGVGKTTLLKCAMGLMRWQKGQTLLDGTPITEIPHRELWQKIAYVPQAKSAPFSLTAREMVLMGRTAYLGAFHQPSKEDRRMAEQALNDLHVGHLAGKACNRMSGGELQMVLIARALVANPGVLILDEPESNLDFKNQLVILDVMRRLSAEKGIACIFNTHYPNHALAISSHALLLDKEGGSVFADAEEVITEDNMRRAFGVNVHIGDVTVKEQLYKSVLALSIA